MPIDRAAQPPQPMKTGSRFSLKPFGDRLLTGSASFWIFSARLIIITMAAAEAMAWGYMGWIMSQSHPMVAAAVAATFIFVLIWIIDASFMTLDLSGSSYERGLTDREANAVKDRLKVAAGVVARIGIVTASLLITAPFLAQAIFSEDIRSEMDRRNAATIAATRHEAEQPYLDRLASLRSEQSLLEQQRVEEAAGVGPSGRYGRGPALETIELQLGEKRSEVASLDQARTDAMARFDALSPAELEQRYGLRLLTPGIQTSSALLDEMMANPQFSRAELAVRAFLAILFVGLLILKLFQPRSVAIYYSERLQSLYDEYTKGIFDDYLPKAERAGEGGSIDPLRFEDWCLETYPIIRREEERRRRTATEQRIHEDLMHRLSELARSAGDELDAVRERHARAVSEYQELEDSLRKVRSELDSQTGELDDVEALCASMRAQIDQSDMDGPTFERAMVASRRLDERRRELSSSLRASRLEEESLARRIEHARRTADELGRVREERRATLLDYESRMRDERRAYSERIARQPQGHESARHPVASLSTT